jgi:hypothetical protein
MGWREKVELLAHVVLLLAGRVTSVKSVRSVSVSADGCVRTQYSISMTGSPGARESSTLVFYRYKMNSSRWDTAVGRAVHAGTR